MRRVSFFLVGLLLLAGCQQGLGQSQPAIEEKPGAEAEKPASAPKQIELSGPTTVGTVRPEETDFLAEAVAMNSEKHPPPQPKFRPGHATPRSSDAPVATKTDSGFSIQMPSGTPIATPTVYQGRLYVSGGFSCKEYYCFDARTGASVWAVDLDDDGPSAAVASDDSIIFNTESCTIFVVDAATGKLRWAHWLGDPLMSVPTVANGRVFTVYPVEPSAGLDQQEAPGQADAGDKTPPKPAVAANSQEQGKKPPTAKKPARPTHVLVCFDLKTGKTLWQRWVDTECMSAPIAAGGRLYVTTFSGTLYQFNQSDGRILAAGRLRATSAPVIAGGYLYYTRRTDTQDRDAAVSEAIAKQNRSTGIETFLAGGRAAPYLDWKIQVKAESTVSAAAMESINAIGGGFGGGFGGGPEGGFYALAPEGVGDGQQPGQTQPAPPAPATPPLEMQPAEEPAEGDPAPLGKAKTQDGSAMDQPPPDLLARTERLAAAVVGQGNVSMLQSYHGSRVLHWAERNYNCMGDLAVCTSAKSGKVLWSVRLEGDLEKLGGYLAAPPVAAGGQLFLATLAGDVLQIDPLNGNIKKTYKVGSPIRFPPSVEKGRIYVGTQDGKVVCVDTGNEQFSGWPTWGGDPAHSGVPKVSRQ